MNITLGISVNLIVPLVIFEYLISLAAMEIRDLYSNSMTLVNVGLRLLLHCAILGGIVATALYGIKQQNQ